MDTTITTLPKVRALFVANLLRVYKEFPQMKLSTENIFGLTPFDFSEIYSKPDGPFHSLKRDIPIDLTKYTENYFLTNQTWLMDSLATTMARQFLVETLVLLGVLSDRFFVPTNMADPNSDWIVCDIEPPDPVRVDKRRTVWYCDDLENPKQKVSFMLLTAENTQFRGIKGVGAGRAFKITYQHVLSMSKRPFLFTDVPVDGNRLAMESSFHYDVRPIYYQSLFRTKDRTNRALLSKYKYVSPWLLHTFILADSNFYIDNAYLADLLKYLSAVHRYVKSEYERRLRDSALDAEEFLHRAHEAILRH